VSATPASDAWDEHLKRCDQCNYDKDCMGCAADEPDNGAHSCNCTLGAGGKGVHFRRAYEQERESLKPPKTDGLGNALVADAMYFVQDSRTFVGNCGSWWAPNGAGYVCCIDDAGQYTGTRVAGMRDTDVPWPVEYVLANTVRHVRVDTRAFDRRNYKPGPRS
jgi:hypothetical protein